MKRILAPVPLAFLAACFSPNTGLSDEMPEDLPVGVCGDTGGDTDCSTSTGDESSEGTTESSGTTGAVGDECAATADCLGDAACVAPWDTSAGTRAPFACEFMCVPLLAESMWCRDDTACCDANATCTERGYCILK